MTDLFEEAGQPLFKTLKVRAFGRTDRQVLDDAVKNQMRYAYINNGIVFAVSLTQLQIQNLRENTKCYRYNNLTKKWESI